MESAPTEVNTVGHPGQHNEPENSAETPIPDHLPAAELTDRASYPTRLRLILILAILTWLCLIFAIAGIIRKL
jgi:hypothetical protein